jgi:hypothetical protein
MNLDFEVLILFSSSFNLDFGIISLNKRRKNMTPEKALEILDGKAYREQSARGLDEERAATRKKIKPAERESAWAAGAVNAFSLVKAQLMTRKIYVGLMIGVLMAFYLLTYAAISPEAYKKGLNDALASMTPNLTWAQKEIKSQIRQISQLQQDLGRSYDHALQLQQELDRSKEELKSVNLQKAQSSQSLGEADNQLDSARRDISRKEKQISRLQNEVSETLQERDIVEVAVADKGKQLEAAQKDISDKLRQMNALQQDLGQSQYNSTLLQQKITDAGQDLKSMSQQKEELAVSLKETQDSIPAKISAAALPLQKQIDQLTRQLSLAHSQQALKGSMCQ